MPADDPRRSAVRLANPLSDQAPLMRTSVLDTLLDSLRRNVSRGQRDVALFELGMVTRPLPGASHTAPVPGVDRRPDDATIASIDAAVPRKPRHAAVVLTGDADRAGWWGKLAVPPTGPTRSTRCGRWREPWPSGRGERRRRGPLAPGPVRRDHPRGRDPRRVCR
jgi:phenylalanyl-tRNA synthetase beta subunit